MTNWLETILTDEQMAKALDTSRDEFWDSSPLIGVVDYPERVIQAEASYKAGYNEGYREAKRRETIQYLEAI